MISTVLPQARPRINQQARQPAPQDGNQSFVSRGKQLVFQPRALKPPFDTQNEGATIRGTFHGSYLLKKATVRKSFPRLTLPSLPALAIAGPQPCPRNDVIQNQLPVCKIVGGVVVPLRFSMCSFRAIPAGWTVGPNGCGNIDQNGHRRKIGWGSVRRDLAISIT
jgi:hypothetical protein